MSQQSNSKKGNEDIQSGTVRSRSRRSSGTSTSSKISMAVTMAKAKAEAAQARAAHSHKEIELKVEQARVQANLDALNYEKEKDAAIAEANALVAGLQDMGFEVCSKASSQIPQSVKDQRVAAYMSEQASLCSRGLSVRRGSDYALPTLHPPHSQPNNDIFSTPHPLSASQNQATASTDITPYQVHQAPQTSGALLQQSYNQALNSYPALQRGGSRSQQNVKAEPPPFARTHAHKTPYGASYDHSTSTGDLIKYLARSSLVTSGLTTYDDQPINYLAWKTSFFNAIADLDFGLSMAWKRLNEIYASPEAVAQALFNKLEDFPKVAMKDPRRLRDLADLLSELQAVKEDDYLAGFSYLDTSRGIKPIIEKLPYNLQEKWLYLGTRYKQEHLVSFPPFSMLVDFIATEASARTDPCFNFFTQAPAERKSKWEKPTRTSVYVHKTQVSGTAKNVCEGSTERNDPNKHCPLHRKPHPLRKCRGFRQESINDRKQLLKEHYICFRCFSSTDHLAKNCTAEIKCTECGSATHFTALHTYL